MDRPPLVPAELDVELLACLESETTLVVSNVGVLCEDWDQPAVKCAILARPTKSTGLYLQQAGRILRPWQGQRAIILDHGGCTIEHGLPQDDREFSLEGRKRRKKGVGGETPVQECPTCSAVVAIQTRICPECGTVLFVKRDVPKDRCSRERTRAPRTASWWRGPRPSAG